MDEPAKSTIVARLRAAGVYGMGVDELLDELDLPLIWIGQLANEGLLEDNTDEPDWTHVRLTPKAWGLIIAADLRLTEYDAERIASLLDGKEPNER